MSAKVKKLTVRNRR